MNEVSFTWNTAVISVPDFLVLYPDFVSMRSLVVYDFRFHGC
jgi:hypothetical protein